MAQKNSFDLDDITKQAAGRLFYEHTQRLSQITTTGENLDKLGLAVKMAKALVSTWLDDDPDYQREHDEVALAFKADVRPEEVHPRQWGWERRLEEWECINRSMHRMGVYKTWTLEWDTTPL